MARRSSASRRSGRGVFRTPSLVYWQRRRRRSVASGPAGLALFPPGIPSAEAVGTGSVVPGPVELHPPGIASAEAVGTGTVFNGQPLFPPGIPSAEVVGVGSVAPGPVELHPPGVPSEETVGVGSLTITIDLAKRPQRASDSPGVSYELLCVAVIMQVSGPPTFLTIDALEWSTLSWSSTLSAPQGLAAKCAVSSVTEPVMQRLRNPDRLPTELWLLRDGTKVFAGPLRDFHRVGDDLDITADGLLAYLQRMIVLSDLRFDQVDQFAIVQALVDAWQSLPYGHFGIDTSAVGLSGRPRDRTFVHAENNNVATRVRELGAVDDGFDAEIDPETRQLQLWYPLKGSDRSSGTGAVIFDDRNITTPDVMCSVSPDQLASYAFGTGSVTGSDTALTSFYYDPDLAAAYGASAIQGSWTDVVDQDTLDAHTIALLEAHNRALLVPGPKTRVTPDADLSAYAEGDTVWFDMDSQLGVNGAFRIRKRTIDVASTGDESVGMEFV